MENWKLYALAAAVFAGLTSVVAKAGLATLSADVGLLVRTGFVFLFVIINVCLWTENAGAAGALRGVGPRAVALLALSALLTTLSWICYYRAMKAGTVSYVALVDKGSIVVTLALSVALLGEPFTWRLAAGGALITGGLVVLAGGK